MPATVPSSTRRVVVIGAGVVGLTVALETRKRGYEVVIVADRLAPEITSVIAGALWEWPPAVCGHHRDPTSLERSKQWAGISYERFGDLALDPRTGVHVRPTVFYFRRPLDEIPFELRKMRELAENVDGFRRDAALAAEHGVATDAGIQDAYTHLAPMIDTEHYLQWLQQEVVAAGCQIARDRVVGPLVEREGELLRKFGGQAIVNCSGLGAAKLVPDRRVYPLRGSLIHVRNDGTDMPPIKTAHCMSFDESVGGQNMVFIVPRGRDRLVLGGLVQPGEWDTDVTMDDPEVQQMLERCRAFLPVLHRARPITEQPVRTGLRPARHGNVRLELESGTSIVHCYGHGGSGVTLSWGAAAEVAELLDKIMS